MKAKCEIRNLRKAANSGRAFTLIELLVVVSIITVLVGIVVPAAITALKLAYVMRGQARVTELSQAIDMFRQDKNYYPGQRETDKLQITAGDATKYTGGQILAAKLFEYTITDADITGKPVLSHKYMRPLRTLDKNGNVVHSESGLFDPKVISPNYCEMPRPNSLSDCYGGKPMAIMYFPARPEKTGLAQYVETDNRDYLVNNEKSDAAFKGWTGGTFAEFVRDKRSTSTAVPYNPGKYLLIAPGWDRKYGTNDDIMNRP